MFLKPIKKTKAFVSEIKTKHGKPFTVKLANVRIQDVFHLKESQGQLLHVSINAESSAFAAIRTLDEKALQETLQRKNLWFPHSALSNDKILKYFRHSISYESNMLSVIVSQCQEPTHVEWLGESLQCFEAALGKGKKAIRDVVAHMTIEAEGLYFYGQKFGIRWILRSVSFTSATMEMGDTDAGVDKEDIEDAWAEELFDLYEIMMDDIAVLESKIQMIREEKEKVQQLLSAATNMSEMNQGWNNTLEELRDRVAKYRGGML